MPRQNRMPAPGIEARKPQEAPHKNLDAEKDRPEDGNEERDRPRDQQRRAVWIIDRDGFRQHFRKNKENGGHETRGVDHAAITNKSNKTARSKRRCSNVDERVAEKGRTNQPLPARQKTVDLGCTLIAIFLQAMHARPRRGG